MTNTPRTILIIDDDESSRELIRLHISQVLPDVRVEEYDPAANGLPPSTFDWTGCDLIILDYLLSDELTGLDLLQEWKKQPGFPPVIMLTGKGNEEVAVRAMKTGVQDYLRKQNISAERLRQAILDAMERHRSSCEQQLLNPSQSFSKIAFYKKLERTLQSDHPTAVFFLIELVNYDSIGEQTDMLRQDDVIRHVAGIVYRAFENGSYGASITRVSDSTLGLLFEPPPQCSVAGEVGRLNELLLQNPYHFDDELIPLTIRIGVVYLKDFARPAYELMRCARLACNSVATEATEAYAVYEERARPAPKVAAQKTTVTDPPTPGPAAPPAAPPEKSLLELTLEMPGEKVQARGRHDAAGDGQETDLGEVEAAMDDEYDILQALNDKRILQYFQPVMPLSEAAMRDEAEFFSIFVRMVATDGTIIAADKVIDSLRNVRNQKLLDRWMLRESIGRVLQLNRQEDRKYRFLVKISDESVADANLFNWLQNKLMKRIDKKESSRSIIIEITAGTYLSRPRQIEALFKYLRQTYGFRFALAGFEDTGQLEQCVRKKRFDAYTVHNRLLSELIRQKQKQETAEIPAVVAEIRQQNAVLIATHIESATMLTESISSGADFGMGFFIGEPVDHIGRMTQVESYEIT